MKLLLIAICAVGVFASENYDGPEWAPIDISKILPMSQKPGFWDGTIFAEEMMKPNVKERRIVGGQEVSPRNSIQWQVALLQSVTGGFGFICGGTVMSNRAVLTAAHCATGGVSIMAIAGAHFFANNEPTQQRRTIQPANFRIHPNYNPNNLNNDLAMLLVPTLWTINNVVWPSRLPEQFVNEQFVGETARSSGWGLTSNGGSISPMLRFALNQVISNAQCSQVASVVSSQLCVSTANRQGVCNGDSGGPLTVPRGGDPSNRPIQIGIASFVLGGCANGNPSGFTRVTSFVNWIYSFL